VLCSAVDAAAPERQPPLLREFLAAKRYAERRLEQLDVPWTVLRVGGLVDTPGRGRITTTVGDGRSLTISRPDAAVTAVEALQRAHLAHRVVDVGGRPGHAASRR
jgi:NAD(P)H-binding